MIRQRVGHHRDITGAEGQPAAWLENPPEPLGHGKRLVVIVW